MAAKGLDTKPIFAPGQGMSEFARNGFRIARGADLQSAAGAASTAGTTVTTALFTVPANTFVKEIILDVQNKWATSCRQAFTIGDTDDVDRFFTSSGASIYAAGTRSSLRHITLTVGGGGHFYTDAHTINAINTTSSKATATGHAHTYIIYAPNIEFFNVAS